MGGFWTITGEKCIIWRIWFFRRKICSVGGSLSEIARRSHGWAGLGGSRAVIIALSTNMKHIIIALNLCSETLDRTHHHQCHETQEGAMMWPTLTQLSRNAGKAAPHPRLHLRSLMKPSGVMGGQFLGISNYLHSVSCLQWNAMELPAMCFVFRHNARQWNTRESIHRWWSQSPPWHGWEILGDLRCGWASAILSRNCGNFNKLMKCTVKCFFFQFKWSFHKMVTLL